MATRLGSWALTALLVLPMASAHICIKKPEPYAYTQLKADRSPLEAGQYPCKFQNYNSDTRTTLAVGESQTLQFYPNTEDDIVAVGGGSAGAAVHDGGSCQLSITLDQQPDSDSVFKAFYSIEGGCPGINGKTSEFEYTLPPSIPNGDAIFAWTWFPVSSGADEMYMNCAPITVTGGADDDTEFSNLPDMFVANIPEKSCATVPGTVVEFPDPGLLFHNESNLILKNDLVSPTGAACGTVGSTTLTTPGQAQAPSTTAASLPTAAISTPAGGFIELSVVASASASSAAPATTFVTATTPANFAEASAVPTQTTPLGTPAATPGGPCNASNSGQIVCNGTDQFGVCNWGSVVWQAVAAGTTCENGSIKATKEEARALHHKKRSAHLHHLHGRRSSGWH